MQRKNQPKMGKSRFGILLGRKSSKFVCYLKHAITRNSYLKNRQQALYSCSISDVVQLLHLGHQHHALLRVILLLILFVSILEITQFYSSIVLWFVGNKSRVMSNFCLFGILEDSGWIEDTGTGWIKHSSQHVYRLNLIIYYSVSYAIQFNINNFSYGLGRLEPDKNNLFLLQG